MIDEWGSGNNTDLLRQQFEFAQGHGECQICRVPLVETDGGVAVSASKDRLNLMMCRSCAAGMALSILLTLSNEEVAKIVGRWANQPRGSVSETVYRPSGI